MRTFDEAAKHVIAVRNLPLDEILERQHQFAQDVEGSPIIHDTCEAMIDMLLDRVSSGEFYPEDALRAAFINGVIAGTTIGVYMERQEVEAK